MTARLASWLGYDPLHVAALPPPAQRALAVVAVCALPALALLALSAGYGAFLAGDSGPLAVAVGVGAGLYLGNLLRVSVAGGGVAAHQPVAQVATWAPRAVPLVMLGLLGAFFAQPLILALLAQEQDAAIAELEQSLVSMHEAAVTFPAREALERARADLQAAAGRREVRRGALERELAELAELEASPGAEGAATLGRVLAAAVLEERAALRAAEHELEDASRRVVAWTDAEARLRAEDVAPYREHLARSHFLLRRVQLTWAAPLRPLALSAVMVLLMVLPWVASATVGREAQRAYEKRRWAHTRATVEVAYEASRRLEAAARDRWRPAGPLREERFEDPPYNTRPRRPVASAGSPHG